MNQHTCKWYEVEEHDITSFGSEFTEMYTVDYCKNPKSRHGVCNPNACLIHSDMEIEGLRNEITRLQAELSYKTGTEEERFAEEEHILADDLYWQDRCNACQINDYSFRNDCNLSSSYCYPDFIDEEEMEL